MNRRSSQAFAHWNEVVHQICGNFSTTPADGDTEFIGDIAHRNLGGLDVAQISCNAGLIRHQPGKTDRGDDQYYFLVMQQQGVLQVQSGERQWSLWPGDMALLDSAASFFLRPQGMFRQVSLHLSRSAVGNAMRRRPVVSDVLRQDSLNGQLLRAMVERIAADDASGMVAGDGQALQQALVALLQPVLPHEVPDQATAIRQMAERLLDQSLCTPPSPAQLAARLNVSVRQLYRYFELNDDSISRYVLRRRLEHSARDLLQGATRTTSVTQVAFKWGFNDSAHFSRTFKRHYGMAPKDYRQSRRPN